MRKLICILLCCVILAMPVCAFDGITSAQSQTTVHADGSCQVTLTAALQLNTTSAPVFPLPETAGNISVNGGHAKISRGNNAKIVDLSGIVGGAGNYTLTFQYTLSDTVAADEKGNLTLTVPLLSGFGLPIENMAFSIQLPEQPEHRPHFNSTYLDESAIEMTILENTVSGTIDQRLPDHENLAMTLQVSQEMFPNVATGGLVLNTLDLIIAAFFLLALAYWLVAMRCLPPRRCRRALPTPGLNAGEIPCRLTGQGIDLTMAVLSWAQMGYLLIQTDDRGRVLLHKRMDMGNERSDVENRLFRSLFSKRDVADATAYRYALLCRKAMTCRSGASITYKKHTGNPLVFRVLSAAIGTLGGVAMALAFANETAWQILLGILLGALGTVAAWQMQSAAKSLHHRDKLPLLMGLGCGILWLLLSLLAGLWHTGLFVVLSQLFAGLAAFYGGRRTESGQQTISEILGLRKFLRTATQDELQRITNSNPHYCHDLAPYALALGVDRSFARKCGNMRLPECPYLVSGADDGMTVAEWCQLLRDTADTMDALQKRLPLDRLLGRRGRL